ncbi:MAG: cyclase family protein [bacterium]|nr:cyclase family protein [bacterium]
MSRIALLLAASLAVACQTVPAEDLSAVFDGRAGRWVDLTHSFGKDTIYWPTDTQGFRLEELAYGRTDGGWFYSAYAFASAEHGGTHLDAPIHFAEGKWTADEIPLSSLIGPAAVVDVADRAQPDYQLSVDDLAAWEAAWGRIPDGAILLLRTGWADRWSDRTAYLGTDATGPDAAAQLHFPGLDPEAAQWLVEERSVAAVGIDTPSIDYGQSSTFRSHVVLYSANIPGFENLARLERLPATGAFLVALPMKIEGGSGGPLRIVAFVPGRP